MRSSAPVPAGHRAASATSSPEVLSLRGVRQVYGSQQVLAPLDLSLEAGTRLLVTGPNGAGKSTLLRIVAGLLRPTTGTRTASTSTVLLTARTGPRRREPVATALCSFAALTGNPAPLEQVRESLHLVGLPEHLWTRPARELSSGQRARTALALALVLDVGLLCLDEPGIHVDREGLETVVEALEILRGRGRTVVLATHDPDLLALPADARLVLRAGRAEEGL